MEKLKTDLVKLITNARKSLNNPYTVETLTTKRGELQRIRGEVELVLDDKDIAETQRDSYIEQFNKLQKECLDVLKQHEEKRIQLEINLDRNIEEDNIVEMDTPLDMNELASVAKLVPNFTGNKEDLNLFISSLEIVNAGIAASKQKSLFNFVFKTKIDTKVQNRVRQIAIPNTVNELVKALTKAFKPVKSPNIILNELTRIVQTQDTIRKFADRIEALVSELNEVQISNLGEQSRDVILQSNGLIAFNAFKNGLRDREIIKTIEASRVKTFAEAVKIAEETSSGMSQNQIMFQNAQYGGNRDTGNRYNGNGNKHYNNDGNSNSNGKGNSCRKCGGTHGNVCYADGKKCNKCGKMNHYARMCRSGNNNGHRVYANTNNQNNNHRGNDRNGRSNRNRNVNHVEIQGNSQNPETVIYTASPDQNHADQ